MEFIRTGIPGFDDLVGNGIPRGHTILISGGPGCGKTIFGLQYVYNGVDMFEEPSAYVFIEESPENIKLNAKNFGWMNFGSYVNKGLYLTRLVIPETFIEDPEGSENDMIKQLNTIPEYVKQHGIKRLVLDSISALSFWISNQAKLRWALCQLSMKLKEAGCTSFFITEIPGDTKHKYSAFEVEEFISDGIVKLMFYPPNRYIHIRKMRGVNHSKKIHPFYITDSGIVINSKEEILWDSLRD
jgi:KaiC/GvpD/RAD55 family RecA-like ATPase